jgi:hypothetical protein
MKWLSFGHDEMARDGGRGIVNTEFISYHGGNERRSRAPIASRMVAKGRAIGVASGHGYAGTMATL